jgi:hypothetical protein
MVYEIFYGIDGIGFAFSVIFYIRYKKRIVPFDSQFDHALSMMERGYVPARFKGRTRSGNKYNPIQTERFENLLRAP